MSSWNFWVTWNFTVKLLVNIQTNMHGLLAVLVPEWWGWTERGGVESWVIWKTFLRFSGQSPESEWQTSWKFCLLIPWSINAVISSENFHGYSIILLSSKVASVCRIYNIQTSHIHTCLVSFSQSHAWKVPNKYLFYTWMQESLVFLNAEEVPF